SSRAPFIRSSTAPLTQFVVDCPRLHGPIAAARGDGASIGRTSHAQNLSARGQRLAQSQTSRVPKFDLAGFVPISVAGNQPAAARRKREGPNIALMRFDAGLLSAGCEVPGLERAVTDACRERF